MIKQIIRSFFGERFIRGMKNILFSHKGEPVTYGSHNLRYIVGTRPVRLSYLNSSNVNVRNDARQIDFFLKNVRLGETVLDVGAHAGQYAVLFGSLVGDSGRVVSFEPDATARAILHRNLKLNKSSSVVKVEEIALSDTGGTQVFYSNGGDSMSSLVRSGLGSNASAPSVTEHIVTTMRLDDYVAAHGRGYPQWMKIDTEGAEINILRGARKVLESGVGILCELHPYAWNEFGTTFDELLEIVRSCGRKIRYLDDQYKIEDGPIYGSVIIS